ncbi:MAG: hypothetical protein ABSG88_20420 [Bradyrhizobium sp.]
MRAIGLLALLAGVITTPALAGSWKFDPDDHGHAILTYSEDSK